MMEMVMTVRGPVPPTGLDYVLPHEHLFHLLYEKDPLFTLLSAPTTATGSQAVLTMEQLHHFRSLPWFGGGSNLMLTRDDEIFRELEALVEATTSTLCGAQGVVVDVTTEQEGRNVSKLVQLATRLPLHLVATTSVDIAMVAGFPTSMLIEEKINRVAKSLMTELLAVWNRWI
jgi:predicted metal-dependent phosphotriesterase family hydrolase